MARSRLALALLLATACVGVGLLQSVPAGAAQPANPNDPCALNGRDTCNTTGVGAYHTTQYGLRWYGDYRGAVAGVGGVFFCIDLNFWFPGRQYDYQLRSAANLHNKAGAAVSDVTLHKLAYAIWNDGRTNDPNEQAAIMLYVHGLMADDNPAVVAPNSIGPTVKALYDKVASAAAKYAGPYTISSQMSRALTAGSPATLTLRVRAASGALVPNVTFNLDVSGAANAPQQVMSDASGTATVTLTPDDTHGLFVKAVAANLASNLPLLYVPMSGAAAANGQRLITGAPQSLSTTANAAVSLAQPTISSQATPATVSTGASDNDALTIAGLPSGYQTNVQVAAYGPAASQSAITCTGTPAASVTYTAGNGQSNAPAVTPTQPGWYGYQVTIPGSSTVAATTSPCAPASESFEVTVAPTVHTQVSSAAAAPGTSLSDTVIVSGLQGQSATVNANLYGPYPTAAAINCQGTPAWTGQIAVTGDGTYQTETTTLQTPGYYVYVESIAAQGLVAATSTSCSDTTETTIVTGTPIVTTQISAAQTAPGATLSDTATVSGLGSLQATVNVVLWGPYQSKADINCTGTPAWSGNFTAAGDGTYTTANATVPAAGYYVYQESIAATNAYAGVQTPCADTTEMTFAKGAPQIGTAASAEAVHPGSSVFDTIHVSGLGKTPATIHVALYGPFASLAALRCGGRPAWTGTVEATGNGVVRSPATTIPRVGFYVYRESIAPSALIAGVQTPCAMAPETVLGTPMIITGPGAPVFHATPYPIRPPAPGAAPVRIQIAGIVSAPIEREGIDLRLGDLAVPADIHQVAWWQDSATPGASAGTVLLAGHINAAGVGPGAFYPLAFSTMGGPSLIGKTVTITARSGRQYRYRITTAFQVPKAQLPASVFNRIGPPKLVMVTCGGPFDSQTGHYLNNVVVVATPV